METVDHIVELSRQLSDDAYRDLVYQISVVEQDRRKAQQQVSQARAELVKTLRDEGELAAPPTRWVKPATQARAYMTGDHATLDSVEYVSQTDFNTDMPGTFGVSTWRRADGQPLDGELPETSPTTGGAPVEAPMQPGGLVETVPWEPDTAYHPGQRVWDDGDFDVVAEVSPGGPHPAEDPAHYRPVPA